MLEFIRVKQQILQEARNPKERFLLKVWFINLFLLPLVSILINASLRFLILQYLFFIHLEPPSFLTKSVSQDTLPGSTVCLKTTFKGTPPLSIRWFKGVDELKTGGSCYIAKENTSSSLELYAVKTSESGNYVCKVSNKAGAVECSANLFVKGLTSSLFLQLRIPSLTLLPRVSLFLTIF